MSKETTESPTLPVSAGDVLALRGTGLVAAETWALLCQAAQALQDLFLSNSGVVGSGSRAGPVVTPHTLELTPRGRVTLQVAPPETARAYLPPEYRPGRLYSDTESEKMWMYSLGRALLDTTPRVAALTGSVSVSPPSALQSVLAAMTEPDPQRRASLMNLLDVISEYCRMRLLSKPFTHIVMDMYWEVVRSPQYTARKRATTHQVRQLHPYYHHPRRHHPTKNKSQPQNPLSENNQQLSGNHHYSKHQKGNLFKTQSRNSRSHPNLPSLLQGDQRILQSAKPQFQSQVDIKSGNILLDGQVSHSRTNSQPIYSECSSKNPLIGGRADNHVAEPIKKENNTNGNVTKPSISGSSVYSEPIYAFPIKPFLSSQDVRVNGLSAVKWHPLAERKDVYPQPIPIKENPRSGTCCTWSQPSIAHCVKINEHMPYQHEHNPLHINNNNNFPSQFNQAQLPRQYSNVELPANNHNVNQDSLELRQNLVRSNTTELNRELRNVVGSNDDHSSHQQQQKQYLNRTQQNPESSTIPQGLHKPVPPKPPRIGSNFNGQAVLHAQNNSSSPPPPPPKPPRNAVRNGPRARRGKPIQRAPSRLYRTLSGPMRCFNNKTQCVGPEFVVRANQPPKLLSVGDAKGNNVGRLVVILLSGQRIDVVCDRQKITAGELFQSIVQTEQLEENFTLGLAALLAGDFAMLPPEIKLHKVAPPGWLNNDKNKGPLCLPTSFMLYLRQRFFLPSLRGIRSWISKHLLYLQIRRCILEQQLVCTLPQLINLTGLALQAEFGNYNENEHGRGNYFLLEHYVPETLILSTPDQPRPHLNCNINVLTTQLHRAHQNRRGLDANTAEELFITHAQELDDYGLHLYIATIETKALKRIIERLKKAQSYICPKASASSCSIKCVSATESTCKLDNIIDYPVANNIDYNSDNYSNLNAIVSAPNDQEVDYIINSNGKENVYMVPKNSLIMNSIDIDKDLKKNNDDKSKTKKSESKIWFGVYGQGIKLFKRAGQFREVSELIKLQWKDIQTLSYSKNNLVIYTKFNGKRVKFKLNMDHKKSYYAFKLTSLHHQFFLKLRSELTSLQGLIKDFGVPLSLENSVTSPFKQKIKISKMKISIGNIGKIKINDDTCNKTTLEDYQNKENENPEKDSSDWQPKNNEDSVCYTPEEEDDTLYAQVNARLEPEGASRDTEDESERSQMNFNEKIENTQYPALFKEEKIFINNYESIGKLCDRQQIIYDVPKSKPLNNNYDASKEAVIQHPAEELYAAINKTGNSKKNDVNKYRLPEQMCNIKNKELDIKSIIKAKSSSLPNHYDSSKQSIQGSSVRTPSLPRRLGVKMGTRAIYNSNSIPKDSSDDLELLSTQSDTTLSIQSTVSAQSSQQESPMTEAYVLNADIRVDDESFHLSNDETMSTSLMARLEELSFAEERILSTIKLERGHGGSIGLQVTEGNDGGVYVQAVSVGGSADMAGNINKGDRIVAINGQSLLNFRYEDALKMLQNSSSETVELVLSQVTERASKQQNQFQNTNSVNNHNSNEHFNKGNSSSDVHSSVTREWLPRKLSDPLAFNQNSSSTYNSARSSSMDNYDVHNFYNIDRAVTRNGLNSASLLLSPEDFDVSTSSHQVFI
ncbi:uncharacterized protein [Chelonus insularis]|uniref:uncharacterized protein n=1 Tax=Chelonus insularis TaxID=460826 RepID=UPI00158AFF6A|nr:uncharacterized protein LOC118072218 [Chelonus insularis]XP_034947809.1 uncharacterized protein LOC118072218 [Chelonus insularis]